jgi:hypothetical protein
MAPSKTLYGVLPPRHDVLTYALGCRCPCGETDGLIFGDLRGDDVRFR